MYINIGQWTSDSWVCLKNNIRYQIKSYCYVMLPVFCLLWISMIRYWNSDSRSEICSKIGSWWYIDHSNCWKSNFPEIWLKQAKTQILLLFYFFWSSLISYSNSDTRSGFPWKFCIRWYIDHPIWWRSNFQNSQDFVGIVPFMA